MALKANILQAIFARRREAEQIRIERTEAANKYFDHWGKVTARFENWTTPDFYKQADQNLENCKQKKEREKLLAERKEKLAQLLELEKKNYEREMQENQRCKHLKNRNSLGIRTLEKIEDNLKEQQQMRRKLELEAKLYGKWRHGVEDDKLIFQSKSDNEVLAKLNWLDKQVNQQLQREKDEEVAKERQLKLQLELNKSEELRKERQIIRENEIREIRSIQEHHLEQLKERQKETDNLKEKEKELKNVLNDFNKELELLEGSYAALKQNVVFAEAYNLNKIKIFTRKRSETFRSHINLCLCILQRIAEFSEKPEVLYNLKERLEQHLENELEKLSQIEGMYESEAKYSLDRNEELWQQECTARYKELKQILMEECRIKNAYLNDAMKRHEELLEMRATHIGVIENSSEKLKFLVQEAENSPREKSDDIEPYDGIKKIQFSPQYPRKSIIQNQLEESNDTPLFSPHRHASDEIKLSEPLKRHHRTNFSSHSNNDDSRVNVMCPISNSFNNLNLDAWQINPDPSSQRDYESQAIKSQRSLQVVTPETEAERPRFGRKRVAWN